MRRKTLSMRVSAIIMAAVVGMSSMTMNVQAADVHEHIVGSANTVKVTVPAAIDLSYNDGKFTGSGSISARYTDTNEPSDSIRVAVDTSVGYTNTQNSLQKVTGSVSFGESGVADWSVDEIKGQTAKDITIEAPVPKEVGVYEGSIHYDITARVKKEQFYDDEYYGTDYYFTYRQNEDGTVNLTGLTTQGYSWLQSAVNYTESYDSPCMDKYTKDANTLVIPSKFMIDGVLYDVSDVDMRNYDSASSNFQQNVANAIKKAVVLDGVPKLGHGCFNDCYNLAEVELPSSVTILNSNCFKNCHALQSIELPESITSIGDSCFAYCRKLENIELPEGLNSLGSGCFGSCSSLKGIKIPDRITSLKYSCFSGCKALTSVELPDGIASLGNYCFSNCSSLTNIELPESITSVGDECFRDCSKLEGIKIPVGVTSLGTSCFNGCRSLASIELPEGITSLGRDCFNGCSSLPDMKLPESLTLLGERCFIYCNSLNNVKIPDNVTVLPDGCFSDCSSMTNIELPDGITSLGESCFSNCSSLSGITLPESISSLGRNCFSYCGSLDNVQIPSNVTVLPYGCFSNCSSMTNIELPDGITSLGESCFSNCSSLSNIELPESITSLGDSCFHYCSSLTGIRIPSGVTSSLGSYCFAQCSSLTDIELHEGITSLGDYCFNGCSSLTGIEIPEGVASLGDNCFEDCTALNSAKIPESVSSLGEECFRKCEKLEKIAALGAESLGNYCFQFCSGLTECNVPKVTEIGSDCYYSSGLESINCPSVVNIGMLAFESTKLKSINLDNCETIGYGAFQKCVDLADVSMPKVKTIESSAFYNCSLSEIDLPLSVEKIASIAFSDGLQTVNYEGSEQDRDFINIDSNNSALLNAAWNYNSTSSADWQDAYTWELNEDSHTAVCKTPLRHASHMEVPETIVVNGTTYTVTELADNLFADATSSNLSEIVLPDTLTKVGDNAFSGCNSLKTVVLPDDITSIGSGVFYNCTSLSSVTLPSGLTALGVANNEANGCKGLFYGCTSLKELTLPENIKQIGYNTFSGLSNIESISLPDSITSIEGEGKERDSLFSWCDKLKTVRYSANLKTIPAYAFMTAGEFPLVSFTNYSGVESIGEFALKNTQISDFDFSNVVNIAGDAFQNCKNLTVIDFSSNNKIQCAYSCFQDCSNITTAKLPSNLIKISGLFNHCDNLSDIYCDYTYAYRKEMVTGEDTVSESVTWHYGDIDVDLWRYFNWSENKDTLESSCDGLKYDIADAKFEIPFTYTNAEGTHYSVAGFGQDAFRGESRIINLDLPETVTSIASGAFADCTNMTEVHLPASVEFIYDNAFSGCTGIQTVYYAGTREQYDLLVSRKTEGNDALFDAGWVFTNDANGISLMDEIDLSDYVEMVLKSETNLYADRGTDSEVLEKLADNSVVYIISTENEDSGVWYEVYTPDKVKGYIFIENESEEESETDVDLSSYEKLVLESEAVLYADRGTDAEVLKTLESGSAVYIIATEQGENGIWYEVYTADQVRGYIFIESSVEDGTEEETETESATEEGTETEESTDEELSETEESASDEESTETDESTSDGETSDTEESTNEESSGVESTETDESTSEEGSDESSDVEESSGVAESTSEDAGTDEESTETDESSDVGDSEESSEVSEDAGTDESTTVEESSVVETSEEVVIEEGGEDIPEETQSDIPEVKIEVEVRDEDDK